MIEKGKIIFNKVNNKKYKLDIDLKQITFLDNRVYEREKDKYYPSVTSILSYFPKGKWFEDWLKDVGHNAEFIKNRAGREGSEVHDAIEYLLHGNELNWVNENNTANYDLHVWNMINKFVSFWNEVKPELLLTEQFLYSDEYEYAGTADLVVNIDKKRWLIDIKTSNNLHKSYDLQLAAYAKAYEEITGNKIDKAGIIWLKSSKRGPSRKKGVYQGEGWELKEVEDLDTAFKQFLSIYDVFKLDNPKVEPKYSNYPTSLKL